MKCDRCSSERIMSVMGHCVDSFNAQFNGKEYDGYVLNDAGIGEEMTWNSPIVLGVVKYRVNFQYLILT